jgi:hypothetical protein
VTEAPRYKFTIDPDRESKRDTLCQNLRILYRQARTAGDAATMDWIAKAFSMAKQMDARLKYYRAKYEPHRQGPEIPDGEP